MKPIKYRVWNKEKECYFMFDTTIGFAGTSEMWEDPELYTGLKDKNGVEIFEGDILQIDYPDDDSKIKIVYKAPSFCKMSMKEQYDYCIPLDRFDTDNYILIGNINEA